jgi:hypothetical protein
MQLVYFILEYNNNLIYLDGWKFLMFSRFCLCWLLRYGFHHPRAAKERLTQPRQMGGRGLTDITRLHDEQVKLLQTYFLNKQVTSSLHAAVVKADDRCTPLDLSLCKCK